MKAKCWLIGNPDGSFPSNAQAAARMRGLSLFFCPAAEGELRALPAHNRTLLAISFERMRSLSRVEKRRLSESVMSGATLYVRGGLRRGEPLDLAPFMPSTAEAPGEIATSSYRFTFDPLLPRVLHGEHAEGDFRIPAARGLGRQGRPLLVAREADSTLWPALFAIEHGDGIVLCDLHDDVSDERPLLRRLENSATMPGAIGAVIAAERAAGLRPEITPSFNIVIDDRPANLDYFNVHSLRAFLSHLGDRCPGVRVDFAWTPDQSRPSRRYIETLKEFNTGFVWHGLLHHVDHRTVEDPRRDFALGRRLVDEISRRYEVEFQPVMVFPFEKDTAGSIAVLKRAGFIAKAESHDDTAAAEISGAESLSDVGADERDRNFTVLERHDVGALSRERMLARAALGLPIIAAAHPRDVALKRFSRLRRDGGSADCFDEVTGFAAEKKLRPEALEQIAHEMIAARAAAG
ncbi:MAG TPA: hypothetical protein VJ718_04410 [Candidatus Binataceae bacterium]|nr:hypothetical protein [Candidatus Binataceae bacterium]